MSAMLDYDAEFDAYRLVYGDKMCTISTIPDESGPYIVECYDECELIEERQFQALSVEEGLRYALGWVLGEQ